MNKTNEGYTVLNKEVLNNNKISLEAKAMYHYFSSYAENNIVSTLKNETILEELNMSKPTYYKHKKMLIDNGYLTVNRNRTSNRFLAENIYKLNK